MKVTENPELNPKPLDISPRLYQLCLTAEFNLNLIVRGYLRYVIIEKQ